ncbi:MAG: YlbE-like family protein [Bacilli bacterium]|jgi:hypothetical protein
MQLGLQFKIRANPTYQRFLRENSHWYKILNRHPELFNHFISEMKNQYRLTTADKLTDILDKIRLIQSFIRILN